MNIGVYVHNDFAYMHKLDIIVVIFEACKEMFGKNTSDF